MKSEDIRIYKVEYNMGYVNMEILKVLNICEYKNI